MKPKATLYEMLGVQEGANLAELQSAYRRELSSLESMRASMSSEEFNDKAQLLRVTMNTLTDPVSRLSYDSKLAATRRTAAGTVTTRSLATRTLDAGSDGTRADALSLRADALALRADAMLARAGLDDPGPQGASTAQVVASATLTGLKHLSRAVGLLVLVGIGAFAVTRLFTGEPSAPRRAAAEAKANEQTALQSYYQTHGVRPANMAELELLEAERRRRAIQARQAEQNREKEERDARRFEEESRQRGREVSQQLRMAEEQARRNAERDAWQEQIKLQDKRLRDEAEQRRIEREKQQWRETLRR